MKKQAEFKAFKAMIKVNQTQWDNAKNVIEKMNDDAKEFEKAAEKTRQFKEAKEAKAFTEKYNKAKENEGAFKKSWTDLNAK